MLETLTALSFVLAAPTAHASAPERVLIVDAVNFSSVLERAGARQRMLEAVAATAAQHGWQTVPSADCHDFTCAGPAAAAAEAAYALILTGSFSQGGDAMYASEVGASLWHDGSVVARRTEADEQAEADRTGLGVFFPCGPPSGTCTAPLMASKMQQYTARLLEAETAAIQQRKTVAAAAAAKPRAPSPPILMTAPPAPAKEKMSSVGGVIGWSLVGFGAVGIGGSLALWTYNNSGSVCEGVAGSGCRETRHTGVAAATVGGLGVAAVVAGVLLLVLDRAPSHLALTAAPGGLLLGGNF